MTVSEGAREEKREKRGACSKDVPSAVRAPAEAPEPLLELGDWGAHAVVHCELLSGFDASLGLEDDPPLTQLNLQGRVHAPVVHKPAKDKTRQDKTR